MGKSQYKYVATGTVKEREYVGCVYSDGLLDSELPDFIFCDYIGLAIRNRLLFESSDFQSLFIHNAKLMRMEGEKCVEEIYSHKGVLQIYSQDE